MTPLNDQLADEMRALYAAGGIGYRTLGKRFGVNETTARKVVLGRIWNDDGRAQRKPYASPEKDAELQGQKRYWIANDRRTDVQQEYFND